MVGAQGGVLGVADWATAKLAILASRSSISGRRAFIPLVCSHSAAHAERSRCEAASMQPRNSRRSALPQR